MTSKQKSEVEKRSSLYKQGKLETASWSQARKRARSQKQV
jgi:hypothetical protein